jgi:K+-sensing histidine kinase KdpD
MKAAFKVGKFLRDLQQSALHPGPVLRYGIAAVCVLGATSMRLVLNPILGLQAPYLPFALAIMAAALFGGRGPGLAATALSALSAAWFFLPPAYFAIADPAARWGLLLAVLTGTLISLLIGSLRESFLSRAKA